MVLMQLLSKEDVVGLSPRELEVLDSLIDSEIMQSAEIKKILKDKVTDAVTALKKAR
jgi:DNA-binding CsgD family transcriptional regulator